MLRCAILLVLSLTCLVGNAPTQASQPVDSTTAFIDSVLASLRTAASYARTGNVALAQIEIDDTRAEWRKLLGKSRDHAPAPFAASAFTDLLASGMDRLDRADQALGSGDAAAAASEIQTLRHAVHALRRESGAIELSDCVFELAVPMEELRAIAVRFGDTQAAAGDVRNAGFRLRDQLQRCDKLASPEIASQAEFRRLVDGASASAAEIGRAADAGDTGLVHRYQIELQSFIHLLDFRFG